jgi:hypothetical protein
VRGWAPHRDSSSKSGAAKVGLVSNAESVWPRSADPDARHQEQVILHATWWREPIAQGNDAP